MAEPYVCQACKHEAPDGKHPASGCGASTYGGVTMYGGKCSCKDYQPPKPEHEDWAQTMTDDVLDVEADWRLQARLDLQDK